MWLTNYVITGVISLTLLWSVGERPASADSLPKEMDRTLLQAERSADREELLEQRLQRRRNLLLNLLENQPPCGPGTQGQRFVLKEKGTEVCDNTTGLRWQQSPIVAQFSWAKAQQHCKTLMLNGEIWRLPQVRELFSLVNFSVPSQEVALNTPNGLFENVNPAFYWSDTLLQGNSDNAWYVGFAEGTVGFFPTMESELLAWCVHSGP